MTIVNLNKDFTEKNGKYSVSYNNCSGIYSVSKEYYSSCYGEDMRVSVMMGTEEGISVRVDVINIKRISERRKLIAFKVKQTLVKHIENLKRRHNVLDIDFVKDVVSFILNYNVCNRYEVVIEDEVKVEANVEDKVEANVEANVIVDEAKVVEEVIKPKKVDKVSFNKSFEVKINNLVKSYNIETEEIESQYGYTDLLCKMEAMSTIFVDGEYAVIRAYAEVYDGVVISLDIGQSRVHKQLESFISLITAKDISKEVNELIDNIKYEVSSYVYEKDFAFVESIMTIVLNLNSYDSNTCLINNATYSLVDVA